MSIFNLFYTDERIQSLSTSDQVALGVGRVINLFAIGFFAGVFFALLVQFLNAIL